MKITFGNAQHQGCREEQQDAFAFSCADDGDWVEHAGVLGVLADGMGGQPGGREAALVAVHAFIGAHAGKQPEQPLEEVLGVALEEAQEAVQKLSIVGAGSTLVAAAVARWQLRWISVGDSCLLLVRDGKLEQLNRPHIYAQALDRLAEMGEISPEEAASHPERGALVKYVGMKRLENADQSLEPIGLRAGDRVLLASDGLTGPVPGDEIAALAMEGPAQAICERLLEAVLRKNWAEQDNVTILCFAVEADLGPTRRIVWPEAEAAAAESETRPWWKFWAGRKGGPGNGVS